MGDYSHQWVVQQDIDWCRVKEGLAECASIRKHFTLDELKRNAPAPYFCHWLSWRINDWIRSGASRCHLQLLDRLVSTGEKLPGWQCQRVQDPRYDSLWTIVWELQVADAFTRCAGVTEVEWLPHGPDLRLLCLDGQQCYVECYVYGKSHFALTYIQELLWRLSPNFRVWHRQSVPMALPTGQALVRFLDELFRPFVDGGQFLAGLQRKARKDGRADICIPPGACNLKICLTDPKTPAPGDLNNAHGQGAFFGEGFVVDAVAKAVQNKKDRNALSSHRPNVLLVNCLLPVDYQADLDQTLAFYKGQLPDCALKQAKHALDASCFFAHGVNRRLRLHSGHPLYLDRSSHPLVRMLSAGHRGYDH